MDDDFEVDSDYSNWDEIKSRQPWIGKTQNVAPYALVVILILAVISVVIVTKFTGATTEAPEFTVETTDGIMLSQSGMASDDKVVVLDFMATWCKPCKGVAQETISPLHDKYGDDERVIILSVSVSLDDMDDLRNYMTENNYEWPHALDPSNQMVTDYGASSIPVVVVIDMDGTVVMEDQGDSIDFDKLENVVDAALLGQASAVSVNSAHVLLLAVATGALSFLAPCAFPLLPGFVTFYVTANEGRDEDEDINVFAEALPAGIAASSGIFLVYLILGLILAIAGNAAAPLLTYILLPVSLVLLMMGTAWVLKYDYAWITAPIMEPLRNAWWTIKLKLSRNKAPKEQTRDFTGLFSYGVGYGMSSIGCTVPLLIGLTLAASTEFGTFIGSMTVFVIYALSAAMMMIGAILLIAASKRVLVDWMRRNMERIKQVSGGVLILVGIWVMIWFIEYQFLIKILPF